MSTAGRARRDMLKTTAARASPHKCSESAEWQYKAIFVSIRTFSGAIKTVTLEARKTRGKNTARDPNT